MPESDLFCSGGCGGCSCPGYPYQCSDGNCYANDCITETVAQGLEWWVIFLIIAGSLSAAGALLKCLCGGKPSLNDEAPQIVLTERT